MMNLIKLKCENCGASLEVEPTSDKITCKYCSTEMMIDDEASNIRRVEEAKLKARQDNHEQDMKEKRDQEEMESKEKFEKSKFSKVLLVFFAIAVLFFFVSNGFLAKFLIFVQAGLFISAWLMGMKILKEPMKGLKTILAIVAFVLIVPIISTGGGSSSSSDKLEKIDWAEIEMNELLPEPELTKGHIYSNESDRLSLYYGNAKKEDYKEYLKKCKEKKYNIDVDESSDSYTGFNEEGYKLHIYYSDYSKQLDILLDAPEKMKEFEWPQNGLGSKVPKTKSNFGRISWDNEESFIVHVGNMTFEDYVAYVKECENNGYIQNRSKSEKSYRGSNGTGYEVHLMYLGGNVVEVSVKLSEGSTAKEETKKEEPKQEEPKKESNTGLKSDFKAAMDSYETFMNEYVTFMKKYNSNPSDMELLKEYSTYMIKYDDFVSKFEKWENQDLNTAEETYYLEVQTRVNKKLLEAM